MLPPLKDGRWDNCLLLQKELNLFLFCVFFFFWTIYLSFSSFNCFSAHPFFLIFMRATYHFLNIKSYADAIPNVNETYNLMYTFFNRRI